MTIFVSIYLTIFPFVCVDHSYNAEDCKARANCRLSDVLTILKGVLAKYPPLHSPDILTAAGNIIDKIRDHNYSANEHGPVDFYAAIDQLALSFSSRYDNTRFLRHYGIIRVSLLLVMYIVGSLVLRVVYFPSNCLNQPPSLMGGG